MGRCLSIIAGRAALLTALLAPAACGGRVQIGLGDTPDGGSSSAPTTGPLICKPFAPCGGDVRGTWAIASDCYDSEVQQRGCQTFDFGGAESAGSYTFSDRDFTTASMSTVRYVVREPASCAGPAATCDSIQADFRGQLAASSMSTATCSKVGIDCQCTVLANTTAERSGSYTASGDILTLLLDPQSDTVMSVDYCVVGNTLTIHQAGSGGATLVRE